MIHVVGRLIRGYGKGVLFGSTCGRTGLTQITQVCFRSHKQQLFERNIQGQTRSKVAAVHSFTPAEQRTSKLCRGGKKVGMAGGCGVSGMITTGFEPLFQSSEQTDNL